MKARIVKSSKGNYNVVTAKSGIVIGTVYEGDGFVEDGRRHRDFYMRSAEGMFAPECADGIGNAGTLTQLRAYLPAMLRGLDFCEAGCGRITNTGTFCDSCGEEVRVLAHNFARYEMGMSESEAAKIAESCNDGPAATLGEVEAQGWFESSDPDVLADQYEALFAR